MPTTATIASNLPLRPPPSVEPVQRSPVLSPKVAEPRQQRSGSIRPPSPPQRPPTPPQPSPDQKTENGSKKSESIDMGTFQQILDLDEDGEPYDFAWDVVLEYLTQAETTFDEMEAAIAKRDCKTLSSLGHFLKGSSAALGVVQVQNSCELIQHYGTLRDDKTGEDLTAEVALSKISTVLKAAKEEYKEAEVWLKAWHKKVSGPESKGK